MFLGFCGDTYEIWQFVGRIVSIFKIVIPAILVIIGVIALGKAVIASDDKEIKTATNSLIKKFIVAVCIFFVPTIVSAAFSLVDGWSDEGNDYTTCIACVTSPSSDKCKGN